MPSVLSGPLSTARVTDAGQENRRGANRASRRFSPGS